MFPDFQCFTALHDSDQTAEEFLEKHEFGDWGLLPIDHKKANDFNLSNGFKLLSVYKTAHGVKFLVLTNADRSKTFVCLPDEYQQLQLDDCE